MTHNPGITNLPVPLTIFAVAGMRAAGPAAMILEPRITMFPRREVPALSSMIVVLRMAVVWAAQRDAARRRRSGRTRRQDNSLLTGGVTEDNEIEVE